MGTNGSPMGNGIAKKLLKNPLTNPTECGTITMSEGADHPLKEREGRDRSPNPTGASGDLLERPLKKIFKTPLTLDHESDIMNTQQRKENLPNQKGLPP